jgi:hypothetical protein
MADGVHLNDSPPSALLWKLGLGPPQPTSDHGTDNPNNARMLRMNMVLINAANETGNTDESRSSSSMLRFIQRRSAIGASEF